MQACVYTCVCVCVSEVLQVMKLEKSGDRKNCLETQVNRDCL